MHWDFLLSFFFYSIAVFLIAKTIINLFLSWKRYKNCASNPGAGGLFSIEKLRPFVFFKLFANGLTVSFLPQYLMKLAENSHVAPKWASLAFSFYQIAFIVMIIPSGYWMEIKKIKMVLIVATAVEIAILMGFGLSTALWQIFILQAVFGMIIPLSSGAEFAYVFHFSNEANRNQGVALYSNTLRGAMISGIAIGGVLAYHVGMVSVFFLSGGIVFFSLLYLLCFIPDVERQLGEGGLSARKTSFRSVIIGLFHAMKQTDFLKLISCVGIPSGILEEGILFFCFPLFLAYYHVNTVQIGQLLVLFSIGFFLTNRMVAKYVDNVRAEKTVLTLGTLGIAGTLLGLFLLNSQQLFHEAALNKVILMAALLLLGVFRGFLLSPAIAHVSKGPLAYQMGKNVSVSIYRWFETFGRILGPLFLGQLLVGLHYSYQVFLVLSLMYFVAAAVFFAGKRGIR